MYCLWISAQGTGGGGPCELSSIFFECRTGVGERVCGIRVGGGGRGVFDVECCASCACLLFFRVGL